VHEEVNLETYTKWLNTNAVEITSKSPKQES